MSHYSLTANGSRTDNRMVLNSDNGNEIPYQVLLTNTSSPPVNLQTAATITLSDTNNCSTSPVVSIDLDDDARSNMQNSQYFGAAQVTVAAE